MPGFYYSFMEDLSDMPSRIAHHRLVQHGLAQPQFTHPADVVRWLGAVQAQDYLGALWAIGARLPGSTEAAIERAVAERHIIRTWPMRGTLHFVAAADVGWLLNLLAPFAIARSASRFRQLGLDAPTLAHSRKVIERALQGGHQLPREALYQPLEAAHISTAGQRGIHILARLAQEGVLCFGARHGKQHTFTLLSEWVPQPPPLAREPALAEFTRRYFTSHGPATVQDFAWWSGLPVTEARAGLALAQSQLNSETIAGQTYWFASAPPPSVPPTAHLLPAFDEYLVGYKNREAVLDPRHVQRINAGGGMLSPIIVIDGQVRGTWKRVLKKDSVLITLQWFGSAPARALRQAAAAYGAFLNLPVKLDTPAPRAP